MRLPGTRYQEHGWEQVRKLLGRCSLLAARRMDLHLLLERAREAEQLDCYIGALALELRHAQRAGSGNAPGNSYGESVSELATSLAFELQAQPSYWSGLVSAIAGEHARLGVFWRDPAGDGMLRKKFNDMYAGLRDKVDADHYQAATGRECSPNKIYTYRMLDTAYRAIEHAFANWRQQPERVAAILGRAADGIPIEARQMKDIGACKAEWVIRWSASLERFQGAPGPLHTRSKRFSSLKNSPDKIAALMAEIGDYEALSANMGGADDWRGDGAEATAWLDDYWRVVGESEAREAEAGPEGACGDAERDEAALPDVLDRMLQPAADGDDDGGFGLPPPDCGDGDDDGDDDGDGEGLDHAGASQADDDAADIDGAAPPASIPPCDPLLAAADEALAAGVSLPPRFMEMAGAAQDGGSRLLRLLAEESLPVRLAVYHKLLGATDDSYPPAWLDPATGALPTLQQLAALDRISMPTLRKRRGIAIDKLQAAVAAAP